MRVGGLCQARPPVSTLKYSTAVVESAGHDHWGNSRTAGIDAEEIVQQRFYPPEQSSKIAAFNIDKSGILILNHVHTFTIPSTPFTPNAGSSGYYLRLIHQGHAFYTHKANYSNPEQFDRLSTHGNWYVCAHQLDDGSYWIHWIADDNGLILEPENASQKVGPMLIQTLVASFITLVAVIAFFAFFSTSPLLSALAAVVGIFAFIGASSSLSKLCVFYSPRNKSSLKYLERVKTRDRSFFTSPPIHTSHSVVEQIYNEWGIKAKDTDQHCEGNVNHVQEMSWSAMKGEDEVHYEAFFFTCERRSLIMCWHRGDSSVHNPVRLTSAPPFMAINDRIRCFYEKKEKKSILTLRLPSQTHKVISLINLTEGSAYQLRGAGALGIRPNIIERCSLYLQG